MGNDAGAIRRTPSENRAREGFLVLIRPHEDVVLDAAPSQYLRNHRTMTERIDIVAYICPDSELIQEIPLSIQGLSSQGFTGGQIAVGLDPPSSDYPPSPFFHELLYLPEKPRICFLYELIE